MIVFTFHRTKGQVFIIWTNAIRTSVKYKNTDSKGIKKPGIDQLNYISYNCDILLNIINKVAYV